MVSQVEAKVLAELIFSIRQILEKKWECNKDVCQLFIDFEKAYGSIKRDSLYNIENRKLFVF